MESKAKVIMNHIRHHIDPSFQDEVYEDIVEALNMIEMIEKADKENE